MTDENTAIADAAIEAVADDTQATEPAKTETDATATPATEVEAPARRIPVLSEAEQKAFEKLAFEKREESRHRKRAEDEAATLRATLEALRAGKTDDTKPDDVETRARAIAEQRLAEQNVAAAEQQFNAESNAVYAKGKEAYGAEFDEALRALGRVGMDRDILEAAYATDNPHQVLFDLAVDPDKAARVFSLSPTKRAMELAKIAIQPVAQPRKTSAAPAPTKPLAGTSSADRTARDDDDDATWFAKRRAEKAERRKVMGY